MIMISVVESGLTRLQAATGSVDGDLLLQLLDFVLLLLQLGHTRESRVRHVPGLDGRHHLHGWGMHSGECGTFASGIRVQYKHDRK